VTILQLAAIMGGEAPTNTPSNVPPIFHVLVRPWQESVPVELLQRYRPLAKALADATTSEAIDTKRGWRSVDWLVHTFIAQHADAIGWPDEAQKLHDLGPVKRVEDLTTMMQTLNRLGTRARLLSEAANALRIPATNRAARVVERCNRRKYEAMFREYGRNTLDVNDPRPYPGYAELAQNGHKSVESLMKWQPLKGVRCHEIIPTLVVAELLQQAVAMGVERERADALTNWMSDSFYSLMLELAKMRPAVKRPRAKQATA
jgi:hypothetical protein